MASVINGVLFCAKCNKPVDRVDSSIDPMTGDYVFTAFCHGETESTVLTAAEVRAANRIDYTEAFKPGSPTISTEFDKIRTFRG